MFNRYSHQLREAMVHRRKVKLPYVALIIAIVTTCILAYICLATALIPSNTTRDFHFVNENGAITAFSAILLAMGSAFSFASALLLFRANDRPSWLWITITVGLAFFAFDELLQFHEIIGQVLEGRADPGPFRSWNDIIVILYGVIALPIMVVLFPNLIRCRMVAEMFSIAFLFYGVHTLIDSTQEPQTTISVILEESAKLLSVGFLAVGAFFGFLGILWNYTPADTTKKNA